MIRRKNIKILGLDPGLASTGYGIIELSHSRYVHVAHGIIRTDPKKTPGQRLMIIRRSLEELCGIYKPSESGIESLFFAKNSSSAIPVAEAKGVLLLTLEELGIRVREFSPQEIKLSLTGHGRADKRQVQEIVRLLLGLDKIPEPDHSADALAAAICCGNSGILQNRLESGNNV